MRHLRASRAPKLRCWIASLTVATAVLGGMLLTPSFGDAASASPGAGLAASDPQPPVAARPDVVSARLAASSQDSRVEVTSLEDAYSNTYANPDGTLTTETSLTPLRVQQNGSWIDVNYDLRHVDGGWSPVASPIPVIFSDGADTDAAAIGSGGRQVDLSWDVTLPKPSIDGPSATYDLGGGESLVLTANADGFEQSLVLSRPPTSLPQIQLPFGTANLTLSANDAGGFDFVDPSGAVVYTMPAPIMHGAAVDQTSDEYLQSKPVSTDLVQTANGARLDLTASLPWLQDPSMTYPVTIDPTISAVSGGSDTYVQSGDTTAEGSSNLLRVGEQNGSTPVRTYMKWPSAMAGLAGKDIQSATLKLWNRNAGSCAAATMHAYPLTSSWTMAGTVWSNKPTFTTSSNYASSASFAHGYSGSCPAAWVDINVTKIVAAWASGAMDPANGLQLSGTETSGSQWWAFCSRDYDPNAAACTVSSNVPTLSVTYNSYPGIPKSLAVEPSNAVSGTTWTDTLTPEISATIGDGDGGTMRADFEVWAGSSNSPAVEVVSGSKRGSVGSPILWSVPSGNLTDGSTYEFRVRGNDGVDFGPWSAWKVFTVDTVAPQLPKVSSDTWTAGQWSDSNATTGTISWSSAGATRYQYEVDGFFPWTATTATSRSFTFSAQRQHSVAVEALDAAGNVSATATFTFGIGSGSLTYPLDGSTTQHQALLKAVGPDSTPYVSYQWRLGATSAWKGIPQGDVTDYATGGAPSSWPLTTQSPTYLWDLKHTVGTDGAVAVRACFSAYVDGSYPTCSTPSTVQFAAGSFGASSAAEQVGPGLLSMATGDYSVSASDVNITAYNSSLSLGRAFTTLSPAAATTSATGVFGPGWTASLQGPDAGQANLIPSPATDKSYINFSSADGDEQTYEATSALTSYPINYEGLASASDSQLTVQWADAGTITMTDSTADIQTTWKLQNGAWAPDSVTAVSDSAESTSSFYYDSNNQSSTFGLPIRIVAPAPNGVDCSTAAKADSTEACRSITFHYTTVALPDNSTVQRLEEVRLRAYEPATAQMATTPVEDYDYDSNGRLADAWDPRVTPTLKTRYTYADNGRLSTITPPGLAPWTLFYDSTGRVKAVGRPDPSGQDAISTIVYDVPISGSNAPIDLSQSSVQSWGQSDYPTIGTAIFPPDYVPNGDTPATLTSADWPYAAITYMDVSGYDVEDAEYGSGDWQLDSTSYDYDGSESFSLTSANRLQALSPDADTDPYVASLPDSAMRAELLSTQEVYNNDGDLTQETGPTHPVTLDDGSVIDARNAASYTYQNDLETSATTFALGMDGGQNDPQSSTMSYDKFAGDADNTSGWTLGVPTSQTDPGGLTTKTRYNAAGQVIEQLLPGDPNGTGPRTTIFTYYAAAGSGSCVSQIYAGLLCSAAPAAQPATGDPLPVTTYSYDMYANTTSSTETYGTGDSSVTRTRTATYDAAERPIQTSISVTPTSAGGTPLPDVHYGYDPASGLPTTTSSGSGAGEHTLTRGYDDLGQMVSYTDATQNQSSIGYDVDGRVNSVSDGIGTTRYTYDSASEHRGLITSEDIGVSGAESIFTASYDDSESPTITFPNGLVAGYTQDNAGDPTSLTYTKSGSTWLSFTQAINAQGRIVQQSSPQSRQVFSYDGSGRLTTAQDTTSDAESTTVACTTRVYAYDSDSNRTSLLTYPDAGADPANGACSTATTPSKTLSQYDQADRLTNDGYGYDALGRTTTIPAVDAQGIGSHAGISGDLAIGYYANDIVATQAQGSASIAFALDPDQNRVETSTEGSTTTTNHYSGDGDSPAWVSTSPTQWTRNISGITGGLAAICDQNGAVTLQLANLHGDIVATADDSTSATGTLSYSESTEYGIPRDSAGASSTYGWLGASERSTNDLGGLTLMGARQYDANTGRFLSTDPIAGGNANSYTYPDDPISESDVTGESACFAKQYQFGWAGAFWLRLYIHWCSNGHKFLRTLATYHWKTNGCFDLGAGGCWGHVWDHFNYDEYWGRQIKGGGYFHWKVAVSAGWMNESNYLTRTICVAAEVNAESNHSAFRGTDTYAYAVFAGTGKCEF